MEISSPRNTGLQAKNTHSARKSITFHLGSFSHIREVSPVMDISASCPNGMTSHFCGRFIKPWCYFNKWNYQNKYQILIQNHREHWAHPLIFSWKFASIFSSSGTRGIHPRIISSIVGLRRILISSLFKISKIWFRNIFGTGVYSQLTQTKFLKTI